MIQKLFFRIGVPLLIAAIFNSCATQDSAQRITVGTFNIAWLGDGNKDRVKRTENDYRAIAEVIRKTHCDVMGLQEIENSAALEKLLKYLPEFQYKIGASAHDQNLAILYNSNVEITGEMEYKPVAIHIGRNRPGFVCTVKKGNFDFYLMVVHFKSTSRYDSTEELRKASRETRTLQAEKVRFWVDSITQFSTEKDIIVVGDFNDYPLRKNNATLMSLFSSPSINFLTAERKSCKSDKLFAIDHIVASKSAMRYLISGSDFMYNFYSELPDEEAKNISDHCPVAVQFYCNIPKENL